MLSELAPAAGIVKVARLITHTSPAGTSLIGISAVSTVLVNICIEAYGNTISTVGIVGLNIPLRRSKWYGINKLTILPPFSRQIIFPDRL